VARKKNRRGAYRVLVRRPDGKNHSVNIGVDGRRMLKLTFKQWIGCMDCIAVIQNRDRQVALVNG
jgi:acetolactate synthase regulatory subunit